ncbi:MAG: hypothetical protein ABEL04_05690 [Salinibacter sp.]|uniref:hypothetical protein n=1 Tax=Salinibacter sp. TaxID=2065818 RepID=UPI0035D43789
MNVEELEQAVSKLPPEKLAEFSEWFREYRADVWDEQIERDAKDGRLDEKIEKAKEDYEAGRTTSL